MPAEIPITEEGKARRARAMAKAKLEVPKSKQTVQEVQAWLEKQRKLADKLAEAMMTRVR